MLKKHIIIISTMLIIGVGFFVTTFLSSRRTSNLYTNKETESKDVSDATSKTYTSQNRFSSPRKAKDAVLKVEETKAAEETTANDSKGPFDTSENLSGMVDSTQNEELPDSLTSQAESRNDDVSQAEKNAAIYAKLEEPFKQLQNLDEQVDSIREKLARDWNLAKSGQEGEIDQYEYAKLLDEHVGIDKQILAICKELAKIIPEAIEIREVERSDMSPFSGYLVGYGIIISKEKVEESLGKIPQEMEAFFPKAFRSIRITNFSYYEEKNRLDSRRGAIQNR